jgi:phosphoribosylformylglycinamidine synthase PurS subunit
MLLEIRIQNKSKARDPEGEVICRDLMRKGGYDCVESVRVAKLLLVKLKAKSREEARKIALRMCNELRIYNPVAHQFEIRVRK